ncbi:uncharacterized protein LOC121852562 [Callorhinchus milii]|uniref:uncharacterized protein LOC121852562 n=1 Tax=Callorhinchus milii TaxID=7868 RepID=UPI001C3F8D85|nr:uncharacterized protein LOC121852562 [Callorhinchus milii]
MDVSYASEGYINLRNSIITSSTSLIEPSKRPSLKPSAARPPRLYGLPKIHKEGTPLRPIVSMINSPTYKLARFLSDTLLPFTGKTSSAVLNSTQLVSMVKDMVLSPDDILVSFDVVSLFTKVPVPDTLTIIEDLVQHGLNSDVPALVRHCLTNTYFTWNGTFYKQNEGTPMGSPLSPVIANMFMGKFESDAIQTSTLRPSLWKRYVDDTFVIWPHGLPALNHFLDHINSRHPSIRFTMEVEKDGKLPFLDILFERRPDGSLGHSVYRKATHTDSYLKPDSPHHPFQKNSLIKTLYHRAHGISDQHHLAVKIAKFAELRCKYRKRREVRQRRAQPPLITQPLSYWMERGQ